jgi:hypothetical protein
MSDAIRVRLSAPQAISAGIDPAYYKGENGLTPHIGDNGHWWIGDSDTGVSAAGDHTQLTGRDAADQHPISAITDLVGELNDKLDGESVLTNADIAAICV